MSRVLLCGGGLQVLSIARSLKESHHYIVVANDDNSISKRSFFIDKCFSISIDNINELYELLSEYNFEVIIPMEDNWARLLSINKKNIESKYKTKCAICEYEIFKIAESKSKLLNFCKENKIPHPKTQLINNNLEEININFPALIKPNYSDGSRGIKMVYSIEEFYQVIDDHVKEYGECSLQEYIENDHYYNVMLYRDAKGMYFNHVITKIKRYYPIKGGSSSFCTTIENENIVSICKKLLDNLNWVGFADFDVLEKNDNDFKIIEINPRVPASLRAAAISGVNYGEIIISDLLNKQIPTYEYKPGKHLRYLGLDIAWFIQSPNRFHAVPSWFIFFGKNLFYQEGGYKDWKSMVYSIYSGVRKILSPSFRKKKSGMN